MAGISRAFVDLLVCKAKHHALGDCVAAVQCVGQTFNVEAGSLDPACLQYDDAHAPSR
jgi:hypothetical protein